MAASLTVCDMGQLGQESTLTFFRVESCVSPARTAQEVWRDQDAVEATPGAPPSARLLLPRLPEWVGDITGLLPATEGLVCSFLCFSF